MSRSKTVEFEVVVYAAAASIHGCRALWLQAFCSDFWTELGNRGRLDRDSCS